MFFLWLFSLVVAFGFGVYYGPRFSAWIDEVI
jgi:hypothetical protein